MGKRQLIFASMYGMLPGLVLLAALLCQAAPLFAGPVSLRGKQKILRLSFLIKASLKNPEVSAYTLKAEGSKEEIIIAKTLPEPVAGFGITDANGFNNPGIGVNSMSALNFSITQPIPFPSKLYTKGRIKKYTYLSLMQKSKALKVNTEYLVRKSYYGLALLTAEAGTLERDRMLLKEIMKDISREYGTGTASAPSYIRSMLEAASLKSESFELNKSVYSLTCLLSELTGLSTEYISRRKAFLPVVPCPVPKVSESLNSGNIYKKSLIIAYSRNPELKSDKYLDEQSRQELTLAKEQYLPDFYLKIGYGDRYSMVPVLSAFVGISLPLYFNGYQRPLIAKAKKEKLVSSYNVLWEKLLIAKRLKTYTNGANADFKNYRLYKYLYVPEARLLFNSETAYFATGKSSAFSLINSFKKLADAEFKLNEFRAEYFINLARLKKIEGSIQNNLNSRRKDYENNER